MTPPSPAAHLRRWAAVCAGIGLPELAEATPTLRREIDPATRFAIRWELGFALAWTALFAGTGSGFALFCALAAPWVAFWMWCWPIRETWVWRVEE